MKRVILTAASIIAFSGVAYAGGIPSSADFTFKPSNNVGSTYFVDTGNQNYVANTKHTAGNRIYSSSNNTSNVFYKESADYKGKLISEVSSDTNTTAGDSTYSGWTSQ